MIGPILVVLGGLVLAATAATAAVATAAVGRVELTRWVAYKLRGTGAAARVLHNPGRAIAAANALTTLGVIAAAGALPAPLARLAPGLPALGLITVFLVVPAFVAAVYLVPRVVGRRWAERIVTRALPWMERAGDLLTPLLPRREPTTRTTLAAVLSGADTEGLASSDEMDVVSGVLAFADRPVRELMTPRTSIVAIPEGMLAAEAAHVCAQSGYSRYPVYRGSLDEIVGAAHAFDLLRLDADAPVPLRPVLSVPGTARAADLMVEMQRGRSHLAVVLDEFGGTAGLVTFDDLLKELVAETFPEQPREGPPRPAKLLELSGAAAASTLADALGLPLDVRGVETVGGLLVQALGRIPRAGERLVYRGLEFDVLAATATRVDRVAVRPAPVRPIVLDRPEERP